MTTRQPKRGEIKWNEFPKEIYKIWLSRNDELEYLEPVQLLHCQQYDETDYTEIVDIGERAINIAKTTLTRRESQILFDIAIDEKTFSQSGYEHNISTERCRQIYDKSRRKMLHPARHEQYLGFNINVKRELLLELGIDRYSDGNYILN
tara:strand:+ start:11383 stop:11829 length:447 start_codon:yes stop_codon:yes gene_type:complete